jgi:hypothetical protein
MKIFHYLAADSNKVLDGTGDCGSLVHYGFVLALVGGAFLIFLYLWRKDKLDMDESPKHRVLKDDSSETTKDSDEENKNG